MNKDLNSAFLYGESIFTTCKVVSGDIYDWSIQLKRLFDSAHKFYSDKSLGYLEERIVETVDVDGFTGALRITIFKDFNSDLDFKISKRKIVNFEKEPVVLKLVKRVQSELLDEFKIGSYGKEFYLKKIIAKDGVDDILFFGEGKVFETSVANIFFRKEKTLFTPQSGIYKGLTRSKLIKRENVVQKDILLEELDSFDEIFLVSSLYEKVIVKDIIR